MEEGEIPSNSVDPISYHAHSVLRDKAAIDTTGATHSSCIEWPGDTDNLSDSLPTGGANAHYVDTDSPSPSASLRLLVERSAVLRKKHKIALLDGYSEIQIGRDIAPPSSDTPRIRLKEMEVSKLHATVYWDYDRSQWCIVDMGSKHGTFIELAAAPMPASSTAQGLNEKGVRLSAPRVASMPRTLHHLDRLTIGGTTFVVHVHEDRIPCTECSPQSGEEIPLFLHHAAGGDTGSNKKRKLDASATEFSDSTPVRDRDPKKALTMLKRSLLSSKGATHTSSDSRVQEYVDRSARRRALFPDRSTPTTPGADRSIRLTPSSSMSVPATPPPPATPPSPPPPAPLTSTNIGHRLLMKQGWQPGTALGEPSSGNVGLVVPLDPPTTVGRAGIGVPARPASSMSAGVDGDWKRAGKKRRWAEVRGEDGVK